MQFDLKSLVNLCIFFVPGIIWAFLSRKYKSGLPTHSDTIFVINSILYSFITYFVENILYHLFYWSCSSACPEINLDNLLSNSTKFIPYVILALPIAFFLSIADIYLHEYQILSNFLRDIGVTKKFGYQDIWEFLLNTKTPGFQWVDVRDVENNIIYSGYIQQFSETEKIRELFLLDVIVYRYDSDKCEEWYRVPKMYISRPYESVILEFRSNNVLEEKQN